MTNSWQEYVKLLPVMGAAAALLYYTIKAIKAGACCGGKKGPPVNPSIMKDQEKVRTEVNVADLEKESTSYCRCWRSQKFPYCDGSHKEYNATCGDNVGPLVIKKQK